MSHRKMLSALAALTCLALLTPGGSTQSSQAERKAEIRKFERAPVVITEVRNLQNENWLRDLEVEVKNVSEKPVYFIHVSLLLPDMPVDPPEPRADGLKPSRVIAGFPLDYGDGRFINLKELSSPQDVPLMPGETYVLRVPDMHVKGLENMKRRKGVGNEVTKRVEIEVNTVSFGDGSGYYGGLKVVHPSRPKAKEGDAPPSPGQVVFDKVGWRRASNTDALRAKEGFYSTPFTPKSRAQLNTCTGGCEKYFFEQKSGAFCIAPNNSVCEQVQARIGTSEPCSRFRPVPFDCNGQPCSRDEIDPTITCAQPCADMDGDGWGGAPCGDDCNDLDSEINPGEFEVCDDGKDNDCANGADSRDPMCRNCNMENQEACRQERGVWDPQHCFCYWTPVLLDTDGDGFVLTGPDGGVGFDLNADGDRERTSWTVAGDDDAWLALDRNGNDRVDDARELFGNLTPQPPSEAPNGFLALAEYDRPERGGNSDGLIDARDAVYASLRLWQDTNHDGASASGELHTLGSLRVGSISLDYREVRRRDRYGNQFRYQAAVGGTGGGIRRRPAYDVLLVIGR